MLLVSIMNMGRCYLYTVFHVTIIDNEVYLIDPYCWNIPYRNSSTASIRDSHYIPIRGPDRWLLTLLWGHAMSALASFKEVRPTGGFTNGETSSETWWFIMGYVGDPTDILYINDVKYDINHYIYISYLYLHYFTLNICWWFLYWC